MCNGAEALAPNLARLTRYAHENGIRIIASSDNHDPSDEEISSNPDFKTTFPPHCLRGTQGQERIAETRLRNPLIVEPEDDPTEVLARLAHHDGDLLFHKHYFDVFTNPNVLPVLRALGVAEVILYGVALDVCDRYAVEGLLTHFPHICPDRGRRCGAGAKRRRARCPAGRLAGARRRPSSKPSKSQGEV